MRRAVIRLRTSKSGGAQAAVAPQRMQFAQTLYVFIRRMCTHQQTVAKGTARGRRHHLHRARSVVQIHQTDPPHQIAMESCCDRPAP